MTNIISIPSIQLSKVIARKFKHDVILLMPESAKPEECCYAMFADYVNNFDTIVDTELLELDGKHVKVKYLDNDRHLRSNGSMYDEFVSKLYSALKNGAVMSDGKQKLYADDVSDFMLRCVLNGFA